MSNPLSHKSEIDQRPESWEDVGHENRGRDAPTSDPTAQGIEVLVQSNPNAPHTGDTTRELHIICRGPSRQYGRKRTTHYGVCNTCGWQSPSRATHERVVADYRNHLNAPRVGCLDA